MAHTARRGAAQVRQFSEANLPYRTQMRMRAVDPQRTFAGSCRLKKRNYPAISSCSGRRHGAQPCPCCLKVYAARVRSSGGLYPPDSAAAWALPQDAAAARGWRQAKGSKPCSTRRVHGERRTGRAGIPHPRRFPKLLRLTPGGRRDGGIRRTGRRQPRCGMEACACGAGSRTLGRPPAAGALRRALHPPVRRLRPRRRGR